MKNITDNLKNAVIVFGLLMLTFAPLEGQQKLKEQSEELWIKKPKKNYFEKSQNFKPWTVKVGVTYNIVQIDEISKNCLGIETLLEKKLKDKLFAEWEIGLYADTRTTSAFIYSKMQTNMGLEYKPIMKNGWAMGGKVAIGVSSEFYKETEEIVPSKRVSLNKLVGLDAEKVFRNGAGINLGVSREIDRKIWRIGIKGILKPESKKRNNWSDRKSYPWPSF